MTLKLTEEVKKISPEEAIDLLAMFCENLNELKRGPQGPRGERGEVGPASQISGPPGARWTAEEIQRIVWDFLTSGDWQGLPGKDGKDGRDGVDGQSNVPGPVGPQGLVGATGPIGPQGPQGLRGDTGATGAVGATGATGLRGETGPRGEVGPQGLAGRNGMTRDEVAALIIEVLKDFGVMTEQTQKLIKARAFAQRMVSEADARMIPLYQQKAQQLDSILGELTPPPTDDLKRLIREVIAEVPPPTRDDLKQLIREVAAETAPTKKRWWRIF